ncbi:ATP-dependent protease ClpP, protease subunit [Halopseudomonas xinjiangensis]|uniref:ATP-dependent Clp protease proteolytic subunit n=1 Tax=Halopseudomonas xinjiangensis TaxID=487184 RepID=A0A1H1QCJ9_9GAMM|nr:ClpP-like prohead protease/major capsid protein fusion protein [Halopseudomonas xinjiangensis]SDS21104.1 ATP-dependent protease ClpP, protease subunit [Halopseudomonas xinjiangensis]
MRNHRMAVLLAPMGALTATNKPEQSWYTIHALARGQAEVLLYDEIGAWGISAQQFARDLKAMGDLSLISLRIHSPGGDVFEGTAIYNLLKHHPARVEAHIDGLAASMASVIAMAADTIYMPENAMMMVHKPWGIQGGDADDMRRYAELLDKVEGTLVQAYVSKTGQSEEDIKALLKGETWMTGREAVEAGFADQLTEPLAAAAQLKSKRMQEFDHMPEALKALMQPRAQGPQAPVTAEPIATAPVAATQPPAQPAVSEADIRAQMQAREEARRAGIRAAFGGFSEGHSALLNECLLDMNVTAEQAKDKLLAKLGESTTPSAAATNPNVIIHAGNGNLVGDSVRNAVESRVGLVAVESGNYFAGMSLMELARASLSHRGVGIAGMDRNGIVGMAFTHSSSDFGTLLADVARKSMLKGLEEAGETFQQWTGKGTLTDFRPAQRVDLTSFPNLDKVAEGAEYKYGTVGDRGEQIMLATYGKLFSITRQAVINDDLSAMTRVPQMMGRAAIRTVADLVYAVLTSNPAMSDGKALFHNDHKNQLAAGSLSVGRIDEAKSAMRLQKDGKAALNIRPAYLLTPVALESTAKALLAAEFDPALADARVPNPIRGLVEVISDPRLDDASKTTSYMTASASMYDTIEVAYLDGNDRPYLEQQQGFTVDGAAFKVRIDAGVAPLSWRTMVKLAGN